MHALDFSLFHSLPMLYCCSRELGQTLVSLTYSKILNESAILSVHWHCTEMRRWQSQKSWFGKARDSESGVHKYLHTLWNSLLPRHWRMSDFTPQTFRPVHSYTFPPSVSRNSVSAVASSAALLAETELSLLSWVTVCGAPSQLLINATGLIGGAVLGTCHVLSIWEPGRENGDAAVELREI